jgi:hypothetical protein
MPETPVPARAAAPARDALQIVLFGLPDAGKSSLLGALAQAAQTQEHALNGRLTDTTQGLEELRRRFSGDGPGETQQEIISYAVIYQPFTLGGDQQLAGALHAVLVDCDGRVATELMMRRRALDPESQAEGLAPSVLEADTLLLVVDGAAHPTQVDSDFSEFNRFLRLLEATRGNRTDVGGLPVYLVLTKSDLLAKPGDSVDAWLERVEESKRLVHQRFKEYLASSTVNEQPGFGSVALKVCATAIKRPLCAGEKEASNEPYGVAELFRQAFEDARAFAERERRSTRRLVWTGAAAVGLVAGMMLMAGVIFSQRHVEEPALRELAGKVEGVRGREATTSSARMRGDLQSRISELIDLQNDPSFNRLPAEQQSFVNQRLEELSAYRDFQDQLARVPPISSVHSTRELEMIEGALKKLEPPEKHRSNWGQTEAVLARGRRLEEIKQYRSAVAEVTDFYDALARNGQGLWAAGGAAGAPVDFGDWVGRVQGLEDEANATPFRPGERLPRSSLTYDAVLRYDAVATARNNWESVRGKLIRLRDLVTALGLSIQPASPAPLNVKSSFTVDQAAARVQELEKYYPGFRDAFTLTGLPEAIALQIRQAAGTRYQYVIAAGQAVVLKRLLDAMAGQKESYESWRKLLPWLAAPEELTSWRVLATTLAHLQDAASGDPINALEAFIRQGKFDLSIRQITLEIPDDAQVRPDGGFTIYLRKLPGDTAPYVFERTGEEKRDLAKGASLWTFRSTQQSIPFEPGNSLWADLPVKYQDSANWKLTWSRSRSQVYQFQRLQEPPRLHPVGQSHLNGKLEDRVIVTVLPENGVPPLPALVPHVPVVD